MRTGAPRIIIKHILTKERTTALKRLSKYRLSLPLALAAAVVLAGAVTLLALWCQPNALRAVLANFRAQPLLIVLSFTKKPSF